MGALCSGQRNDHTHLCSRRYPRGRSLADRPEASVDLSQCILCGRAFSAGKGSDTNQRFCSRLCQGAYDSGFVHREPPATPSHSAAMDS
jgi:hypothetical protein